MQKQVGNVWLMQKINRLKVLNYIRKNPDISRPMLAKATGLSLSSITNIVVYLMEKRLVAETGIEEAD
ncbi:MAG: MarR family transcriptional regulator, partial [Clostridia bacterium]|nr:MarR family transcriptional regulator [Clostridia bacterium]